MEVSAAVESENTRNFLIDGVPSMVSRASLDACASAIISVSWLDAFFAKGIRCVNRVRPAWMPVTAQPAALPVFDPSVNMHRVFLPSLVLSQIRWLAV